MGSVSTEPETPSSNRLLIGMLLVGAALIAVFAIVALSGNAGLNGDGSDTADALTQAGLLASDSSEAAAEGRAGEARRDAASSSARRNGLDAGANGAGANADSDAASTRKNAGGSSGRNATGSNADATKGAAGASSEVSKSSASRNASKANAIARNKGAGAFGALNVRVVDASTKSALSAARVYAPMPYEGVELKYGDVEIPSSHKSKGKDVDGQGVASFAGRSFNGRRNKAFALVVTAAGKVPVVRQLSTDILKKGDRGLTVELHDAVEVRGKVVTREGEAVPEAFIRVRQSESVLSTPEDAFTMRSDYAGEFTFKVASNYGYQLAVAASGFVTTLTKRFDFRRDERTLTITLQSGQGVEGLVMHQGSPVVGANVVSETHGIATLSDGEGRFTLIGLKDQIYRNTFRVRVTHPSFAPVVTTLTVNQQDLVIELPLSGSISGRVLNGEAPVAGARVFGTIEQAKKSYPLAEVYADAAGNYTIAGIGDGQVTLNASDNAGKFATPKPVIATRAAQALEEKDILLGDGYQAQVVLQWDSPSSTSKSIVTNYRFLFQGEEVEEAGGHVTLKGLDVGRHTLRIVQDGVPPDRLAIGVFSATAQLQLSGEESSGMLVTNSAELFNLGANEIHIDIKESKEPQVFVFPVALLQPPERKVAFRLQLDRPESALGLTCELKVIGAGDTTRSFQIDLVNGEATTQSLTLLKDVQYELHIRSSLIEDTSLSVSDMASIADGETRTIALTKTLSLKGYVKDSQGNALPDTRVSLRFQGSSKGSVTSDQHGFFELGGLSEGHHELTAFKHSYYEFKKAFEVNWDNTNPVEIVVLGANEIRITVLDAGGNPVPNANVRLSRPATDNPASPIQYFNIGGTDGTGKKVVNFHWIRHYQVYAYHNNRIGYINFDNIASEPVREFTLNLEPSTTIKGVVQSSTSGARVGGIDIAAQWLSPDPVKGSNAFYKRVNSDGSFSVTVPTGSFDLLCRDSRAYKATTTSAVQGGSSGLVVSVDPKEQVDGNWAEFVSLSVPSSLSEGQNFSATITVRNRGSTSWSEASRHRLGSQAPQDNGTWGMGRVQIPAGVTIAPGQTYTFAVTLKAPKAGTHAMQWRMVQDGKEWFGEYSTKLSVNVGPPAGQ